MYTYEIKNRHDDIARRVTVKTLKEALALLKADLAHIADSGFKEWHLLSIYNNETHDYERYIAVDCV